MTMTYAVGLDTFVRFAKPRCMDAHRHGRGAFAQNAVKALSEYRPRFPQTMRARHTIERVLWIEGRLDCAFSA